MSIKKIADKFAKKTTKKATGKRKALTRRHREAIGNALRSPIVALTQDKPAEARKVVVAAIVKTAASETTGRDAAAQLGISKTSLYRDVLPQLGVTFDELRGEAQAAILRAVEGEPGAATAPTITYTATQWWLTPAVLGENPEGTATALAALAAPGGEEYESQVAATLYWHLWASRRAPEGAFGTGPHTKVWLNPAGAILKVVTGSSREVPTTEEILAAPKHGVDFAAYVAGEALDSPRVSNPALDEQRQKAAMHWLLRLLELGFVSAARVLVRSTRTAASVEASNAAVQVARKLSSRESDRQLAVRLGQPTTAPAISEEVYKVLTATEI